MPYTLPPDAVWFITGCSSGIGLALCTHLSQKPSTRIVATARNPSTLTTLPSTPTILKLALDVTSESSIRAALSATLRAFGRIDILINNAGYNILSEAELVTPSAAAHLMATNFWGPMRLTQLTLPILRSTNARSGRAGGVVLQVTSLGGRLAFAGNAFYHASKFALEGFTEAIAKEVDEGWNVHFACIEPGGVRTAYAATSIAPKPQTSSQAYADPNTQTNLLRKHHEMPEAMSGWVEAEDVAKAIVGVVERGEIPLRVPLGADSWGLQKKGLEAHLERLEAAKEVALSVCSKERGEEQLKAIEFLKV
ncbi:short-chain dehydrogenase/reductase-like protein SDR [Lophiostoma macrostomum CBS 122681]|uniref:Short-chain dehydrogenase/reductase-like protein SDR n=1 Tax=Lophiostoma macrostomum CBS 122681 TaxID=1314788 RepID=A0A6A6TK20_9PLEO|nr:short-chain dehydrogenase/reductase-like protein SDR [Lophiostoma macrostomum CBS 122681]